MAVTDIVFMITMYDIGVLIAWLMPSVAYWMLIACAGI